MGWFSDFVSNPIGTLGDTGQKVVNEVGNAGKAIDQTVRDVLPGGWTTAALLAAGYYYQPEIQAFMNAQGATVPVTEVADAGTSLGTNAVGASSADKALLYGDAGYGAGMTGAQTAAYDAGLAAGAGTAGAAAAGASGGSTLSSMLPYMAAGQIGTGLLQANAATKAADIQSAAANQALAQQQANFNTINAQQAPYRGAGYGALNQLAKMGSGQTQMYDETGKPIGAVSGATDYLTHQFNAEDLAKGLAPNYDFMLQQGQMANQRAANVGGGALSGNTLQGLQKFTQDYAGNAYQNAFNNYQTQRSNIYNTLAGIAGIGQTGQTAANAAGTNLANQAAALGIGSAGAQAAGQVGQTNALANTAQNVIGNYTLASLLNQRGNVG